jgi:hypothetical protein
MRVLLRERMRASLEKQGKKPYIFNMLWQFKGAPEKA